MPLLQDVPVAGELGGAPLAFRVVGTEGDPFTVVRFRGTEGLCRLFRLELDLACSADEPADLDDLIGRSAELSVQTPHGERRFHGVISRLEMTGESIDRTYFRAELVPSVWLLTHRYDSRIFQDKSVPDIIADVLTQAGLAAEQFRFSLERDYPAREYCVQYRETDYNFIARLMEEEGLWWYFDQQESGHVLVMADSTAAYEPLEGPAGLRYAAPTGLNVGEEHVFRFRLGRSIRPGAVALNDFDFEKPQLDLRCRQDAGPDAKLEFSDYPGEYVTQADGLTRAKLRTEEFEAGRVLGLGRTSCHRFAPGRTFALREHPYSACNQSYLLTAVCHEGKQSTARGSADASGRNGVLGGRLHQSLLAARQSDLPAVRELAEALLLIAERCSAGDPTAHRARTEWLYHAGQVARDLASTASAVGANPLDALALPNLIDDVARADLVDYDAPAYQCQFECIPADVSYRPPRITPCPLVRGSQTARVVGPSGEEIHCDAYGRVKVQFHWDRQGGFDERSSCWIRVSQGMAGGEYGMLFLPRIGQEVIVDFLEGNPDRPIITGRVYNRDHMPPYELPKDKTISTIRTCSSKGAGGANEIRFDDAKGHEQLLLHAQNALHLRARGSRFESTGGDLHRTVAQNAYELVKESKHAKVKLDLIEEVEGSKHLHVTGDVKEFFNGKQTKFVSRQYNLLNGDGIWLGSDTSITLWCQGNFIKLDAGGVTIVGKMINLNSGGSAQVAEPDSPSPVEEPKPADTTKFGRNVRYAAQPPEEPPPEPPVEQKTSWIEIELVDDLGSPCAGEPYVVAEPDGKEHHGALDNRGLARVRVKEPGTCRISFPRLDSAVWDRAAGPGPGAMSPGAGE